MRRPLVLLLLLCLGAGCARGATPGVAATEASLETVKGKMTTVFAGLEMYAHDHSLAYPDTIDALIPKYLDALPSDPVGGQPLLYEKTERGYLIKASGDYSAAGAAPGFPRMDQDGFFALREDDFPSAVLPEAAEPVPAHP